MPDNEETLIECKRSDCYWYIGGDSVTWVNNCACGSVTITDKSCQQYIERQEAETRLAKSV